ncbi:MAG: S41 family peptidase [Armatimonadota bacterium]
MLAVVRRAALPLVLVAVISFTAGRAFRGHYGGSSPAGILLARLTSDHRAGFAPVDVFSAVLNALDREYFDRIDDKRKLTYGAVQGMVEALDDPYSQFLTPAQRKALEEAEAGTFHGLGAVVVLKPARYKNVNHLRLTVAATVPGGAARQAGLRAGDVILKVDDAYFFQVPTESDLDSLDRDVLRALLPIPDKTDRTPRFISYSEAVDLLSQDGRQVKLVVRRSGSAKPIEVTAELHEVKVPPLEWSVMHQKVGYVRIPGFTRGCSKALKNALAELQSRGISSLVLDLRDNFGGPMDEMETVAGQLMEGTIGYLQRKGAPRTAITAAASEGRFVGWRIAVLVNEGTMGSAELLAAAVRDRRVGDLVGGTTFGDGLEQMLVPLDDGSALKLTTGKLLTPSGKEFAGKGITPPHKVDGPDKQLAEALQILSQAHT